MGVLTGCGEPIDEAAFSTESEMELPVEADNDNTLFIGMTNAPDSFNPIQTGSAAGQWIQEFFYESLLDMPNPETFEPALAESFTTEDNQTFRIEMNEEASWSDGEAITAHDVAFTLNIIADPMVETNKSMNISMLEGTTEVGIREEGLDELTGVEVIDDYTLELTTKQPVDLAYISEFIGFQVLIAPKHILQEIPVDEINQSEFATQPSVFSGPYQFVEYEESNYVHLEANPTYYKGEPKIETIYARIMNGNNLLTEFQSGGIHMAAGGGLGIVPIQDIAILEETEGIVVEEYPSIHAQYMVINNDEIDNPLVRQAMIHAIDRELLVEQLLLGHAEVVASPYTSESPYKHEGLAPLEYDPELARDLLEEAEYDGSLEIEFVVPTGNQVREQAGDLIQQQLEEVGFTVNQVNYDFPTWMERARNQEYTIGLTGFRQDVDPDTSSFLHSKGSANNYGINDPVIDELLAKGLAETTLEGRKPIYEELQEYLQESAVIIPLYSDSEFSVRSESLNGGIQEFWAGSLTDIHEWTLNEE